MARITCFLVIVSAVVASMVAVARETGFVCNGSKNRHASAECNPYGRRGEKEPSPECCIAYRAFVESAKTTEERKQLCSCVQRNVRINPVNSTIVESLQWKCGMPLIFSADPNFDCNTVNRGTPWKREAGRETPIYM